MVAVDAERSNNSSSNSSSNSTISHETKKSSGGSTFALPLVTTLPILVFIDMFAVALVVPLLIQYYKEAGVASATQRELLSSVFSASQILGGIVLGGMIDAKLLKRKTLLLISFGGSAVAYLMIAYGGVGMLILSRITVGLVKQTMTVTTSMITECTTNETRTKHMGRLASSSTAAWILGPSAGAFLFKYVSPKAPALLASALFVLNSVFTGIVLDDDHQTALGPDSETNSSSSSKQIETNKDNDKNSSSSSSSSTSTSTSSSSGTKTKRSFWESIKFCYSSQSLASIVASLLMYSWMYRATSYSSIGSYYETMYGVEPHYRGYIQSYQKVWAFAVQSSLIQPILKQVGGERKAICCAAILLASANVLEARRNFTVFLAAICPSIALGTSMMSLSLNSLLTQSAPGDAMFSVFAGLDVLQNASAVTVPFYRAFLFRLLNNNHHNHNNDPQHQQQEQQSPAASMDGDPDPVAWVMCAGFHWVIASICIMYLLRPSRPPKRTMSEKKNV